MHAPPADPPDKTDLIAITGAGAFIGGAPARSSGCGDGYLYVVSEEDVPGAFHVRVRTAGS
jgi:hypothetical protein